MVSGLFWLMVNFYRFGMGKLFRSIFPLTLVFLSLFSHYIQNSMETEWWGEGIGGSLKT